jgi:hypothetical protein
MIGSGSASGFLRSDPDPDPHQNDLDPQHCWTQPMYQNFNPLLCGVEESDLCSYPKTYETL